MIESRLWGRRRRTGIIRSSFFFAILVHDFWIVSKTIFVVDGLTLQPCPPTKWSTNTGDIPLSEELLQRTGGRSFFLKQVSKPLRLQGVDEERQWLEENSENIMHWIQDHGAVHLQGFELPKTKPGFSSFCSALSSLEACEDALASIGVRSLLSAADGVYRAVDSESLADTFIGLHNDCTYALAPPFAAFGCFVRAEQGGEFLLADGRKILRALDPEIISTMYNRQLRVRVAGIPASFLAPPDESSLAQSITKRIIQSVAGWGLKTFLPLLRLELAWAEDNSMLQIFEPKKSPINCHPKTGDPTFFSGIHSQSAYLQQSRAAEAFSGVAMTDVFYGETGKSNIMDHIESHVLDHIEQTCSQHTHHIMMEPGGVVLLDSYQVLHGRSTFKDRKSVV